MSDRLVAAIAELVAALRAELAAEAGAAPVPERLLSVDEAATLLGLGRTVAYGELQAGRLASLKVGRRRLVPSGAVADYIAERKPSPVVGEMTGRGRRNGDAVAAERTSQ